MRLFATQTEYADRLAASVCLIMMLVKREFYGYKLIMGLHIDCFFFLKGWGRESLYDSNAITNWSNKHATRANCGTWRWVFGFVSFSCNFDIAIDVCFRNITHQLLVLQSLFQEMCSRLWESLGSHWFGHDSVIVMC